MRLHVFGVAVVGALSFSATSRADLITFVTGEAPDGDVIFKIKFNPKVPFSAVPVVQVVEPDGLRLDGIDYVGDSKRRVAVGATDDAITHYDVFAMTKLTDFVTNTNLVVPPPASGMSRPSTILNTGTLLYYVENQFGFEGFTHRIMRTPVTPSGTVEVVFDGSLPAVPLANFEGLETVGGRLYFFARDPGDAARRALVSIGLDGAGLWDSAPPVLEMTGLGAAPMGDGSDELDFDPLTGLIFGSNVITGEVIAYDPVAGAPVTSPGAMPGFFIDAVQVMSGDPLGLGLLRGLIDGIRSDGEGHIVFVGIAGVMGAIDIAGVLADGADDGDVIPLYVESIADMGFFFDDFTPFREVPEPSTMALASVGALSLLARVCRRRGCAN